MFFVCLCVGQLLISSSHIFNFYQLLSSTSISILIDYNFKSTLPSQFYILVFSFCIDQHNFHPPVSRLANFNQSKSKPAFLFSTKKQNNDFSFFGFSFTAANFFSAKNNFLPFLQLLIISIFFSFFIFFGHGLFRRSRPVGHRHRRRCRCRCRSGPGFSESSLSRKMSEESKVVARVRFKVKEIILSKKTLQFKGASVQF